jgi:hypothetical protein
VETKRAKADSIAGALEAAAECRSVEVATERAAEDELVGSREIRPAADALERRRGLVRERHTANSTRLGCRLRPPADRTGDRQHLASELDVAPTKRE